MTTKLGESLYLSAGYFADYSRLIDSEVQVDIKKYIYCKISNTPPYLTIKDTPADYIERFIVIDEEVKGIENNDTTAQTKPNIKGK
jgi:hypothetical protein